MQRISNFTAYYLKTHSVAHADLGQMVTLCELF